MATTMKTRINGEMIHIELRDGTRFKYIDNSEQCEDCGNDEFSLSAGHGGHNKCLQCDKCGARYSLTAA